MKERYEFSKFDLRTVTRATKKTKVLVILLAHHSHQPPNLMHQSSLNTEIGFMILFDPLSSLIKCLSIHIFSSTTVLTHFSSMILRTSPSKWEPLFEMISCGTFYQKMLLFSMNRATCLAFNME